MSQDLEEDLFIHIQCADIAEQERLVCELEDGLQTATQGEPYRFQRSAGTGYMGTGLEILGIALATGVANAMLDEVYKRTAKAILDFLAKSGSEVSKLFVGEQEVTGKMSRDEVAERIKKGRKKKGKGET